MFVFHFRLRKRLLAAGAAGLTLLLSLILVLSGCQKESSGPITAGTEAEQVAYLESLGWTVDPQPIETMDLLLPEKLTGEWANYAALQKEQGLPFADFAGQSVRRFTYTVTNYPGIPQGVQANLFICGNELIGGDIISLAETGFQTGLAFPKQENT